MHTNEIVCTCANVSKQELVILIKVKKTISLDELCEETGAGMICGGCRPVIQEILNKYNKP